LNLTAYVNTAPAEVHGWLYDYQTLVTGLLALAAAIIAAIIAHHQLKAARAQIKVGREQIEAAKAEADRQRAAKARAARASLPVTLSAICSYAEAVAHQLVAIWPPADIDDLKLEGGVEFPNFPDGAIGSFERMLELATDGGVAERMESILREAQVLDARARGLARRQGINGVYIASCLEQAAAIYARAESLFPFARQQLDTIDAVPLWHRVFAALNIFGVYEGEFDVVLEMARYSKDRGEAPGEADRPWREISDKITGGDIADPLATP